VANKRLALRQASGRSRDQAGLKRSEHGLITVGAMQSGPAGVGGFTKGARCSSVPFGRANPWVQFVLKLGFLVRLSLTNAEFGFTG
jgi:hypothetical protein